MTRANRPVALVFTFTEVIFKRNIEENFSSFGFSLLPRVAVCVSLKVFILPHMAYRVFRVVEVRRQKFRDGVEVMINDNRLSTETNMSNC